VVRVLLHPPSLQGRSLAEYSGTVDFRHPEDAVLTQMDRDLRQASPSLILTDHDGQPASGAAH
jgi:hypothetical protein